jgi:2-keto-4-pentenoate hydratase/2-oxohepta-3-ene-1,7-dioic acid hydratase in catechol pathway
MLGAVETAGDGVRAVLLADEEAVDVRGASGGELPADPGELLATEGWADLVAALDPARGTPVSGRRVAPQPRPSKIVAVGLNYLDHSEESGEEPPAQPLLFAKWPSAIVGPDAAIRVPADKTSQVDYEVELAVVVGRRASAVPPERALGYVGGYTIANDVSARDIQFADGQWTFAKSFDTFCPIGPAIALRTGLPDAQNLAIAATVNGEPRQQARTSDMIFSIAALIAYVSAQVTLMPGDLLLTGTPAGVGLGVEPPRWLADGDEVTCSIEGIGSLSNTVKATAR